MPPKSLFDNSHRPDKLVMPVCTSCNRETSTADLTAAVVSRWDYYGSAQSNLDHRKLVRQIRRQAPEVADEWRTLIDAGPVQRKRARRHLQAYGLDVPVDAGVVTIGPLTIAQLNVFAYKVTLALHFEHFKVPLPVTGRAAALWRTKEDFPRGIPDQLLRLLPRYATLKQGSWDESKTFEYRHDVNLDLGIFGCLAKFRRGLFVTGFTVIDPTVSLDNDDGAWINPPIDPPDLLDDPRFHRKL